MGFVLDEDRRLHTLEVSNVEITLVFRDGHRLTVPLWKYPRLQQATPAQRNNWRIIGRGRGVHWPDLDEDLSVAGFLEGGPAPDCRPSPAHN